MVGMTELRAVGPGDWALLRDIRLDALREAPYAFASTYERELAFPELLWRDRASARNMLLAYLPQAPDRPVGIVGTIEEVPGQLELVSMWVRPQARGRHVGTALVQAAVQVARDRQLPRVHLWVTESNKPARRLYERCGFTPTGERQPLPSDPALMELAMARAADAPGRNS
jgi:ribosomal protein S18 acetylase RimI-like enzyme